MVQERGCHPQGAPSLGLVRMPGVWGQRGPLWRKKQQRSGAGGWGLGSGPSGQHSASRPGAGQLPHRCDATAPPSPRALGAGPNVPTSQSR